MCTAGIIYRLIVSLLVLVVCGGAAPEATTLTFCLFAELSKKTGDANTERRQRPQRSQLGSFSGHRRSLR